ncbi:SDR family oxidoreductase [Nonomuraea glycinis]|uniref:Oxidoreductase n=1 Tax=Nonomuraea glycinis TaxID=2047744 RepID=A0A918A2B1_9ACTN|nr:SDR family oxidoreductase [Nonomuraea glycinis]MCA2175595.1 SDR family oxidoreductase [Nonomuraea glycinis]GGP04990.1 oxidoreductase [Nonomuraea glycinis]
MTDLKGMTDLKSRADLKGKTALVTGASRGMGRAIAQRLATDGALVAVHYSRHADAAKETVAAIEQAGGEAFPVQAEFGTDGDVGTLLTGLTAGLRGRPLDILVNNAACGNLETVWSAGSVDQLTSERFDEVFAINVKAPLFLVQATLPLMPDGGRIVNISSLATRIALPSQIAYAMTKGALEVMSRTLANALGGRGITVNTVRPGSTDTEVNDTLRSPELRAVLTDLTALGRIGRPADIADAVAFLASDDARWITGNVLDATGGAYLGPMWAR